jgi:hypothetical protein
MQELIKRFNDLYNQLEYKAQAPGEHQCFIYDHDSLWLLLKEDRGSFINNYKNILAGLITLLKIHKGYGLEVGYLLEQFKTIPDSDPVSIILKYEQLTDEAVRNKYRNKDNPINMVHV